MNDIREYIRCRDDIFYFIETYLGLELRGYQIDILFKYLGLSTGRTENIISFRGSGLTTINLCYALWLALFHPDTNICIISPRSNAASFKHSSLYELYSKLENKWDKNNTRYGVCKHFDNSITFENNSKIEFSWDLGNNLRGKHFEVLIYDDLFSNPHDIECFKNTAPCGKKYIITNTELFDDKSEMETYGTVSTYPWYCNPDLTLKWYLTKLNSLGKTEFMLKFGCTRGNSNVEL